MCAQAVLPKDLLTMVLFYAEPDPREMIVYKRTVEEMGLKWEHVTNEVCFDFKKVEEAFSRIIHLGHHFGCMKEMLHKFYELVHPTYHIYTACSHWRFRPTNINLFDFIENPAPQEEPALPRLRKLFQDHAVVRKAPLSREQVLVEENENYKIRSAPRQGAA